MSTPGMWKTMHNYKSTNQLYSYFYCLIQGLLQTPLLQQRMHFSNAKKHNTICHHYAFFITAATTASNNKMNNVTIGETHANGNTHFGTLVNMTTTSKTKLHVALSDQFVLDKNDDKHEQNN